MVVQTEKKKKNNNNKVKQQHVVTDCTRPLTPEGYSSQMIIPAISHSKCNAGEPHSR